MYQRRRLGLTLSIVICFLLHAQGADKFTDENRPYEFGFKIDDQQHRHEKKDKDGIIMGEFGFITADNVYHVTVYATDKEGRFKILSMKNIHLKASPAGSTPSSGSRQGHSLALPPAPTAAPRPPPPPPVSQPQKPFESVSLEPPGKSCSSCSIPTTSRPAPPPAPPTYNQANNNYNNAGQFNSPQGGFAPTYQNDAHGGLAGQSNYPGQPDDVAPGQPNSGGTPQQYGGQQNYHVQDAGFSPTLGNGPQNTYTQGAFAGQNYPEEGSGLTPNYPQQYESPQNTPVENNLGGSGPGLGGPNGYAQPGSPGQTQPEQGGQQYPNAPYPEINSQIPAVLANRSPKQYNGPEQQFGPNVGPNYPQSGIGQELAAPAKPTLLSAQMQIVDKNTDIYHLNAGEQEGLPAGLTKHDMVRLLYTFNYTLGFQGHFEEGYTNGVKKGYYFATGRNGIRMRIDYVADDTGFHPKVSQDVLDVLSDDVPKPETERDAKYGLKGYEFKWLYYPLDSKRR